MCYHDLRALNTIIIIIRRSSGNINIGIIFFINLSTNRQGVTYFIYFLYDY